jgi:crossover junction endodeoxyribonuclease RuvC
VGWLAVDPGIRGALAFKAQDGSVLHMFDMPTYAKQAGARGALRDFIDEGELLETVRMAQMLGVDKLICEEVSGLPNQSAAGAFVFGRGYGAVLMAARSCGLAIHTVKAATWKQALRCPADKTAARIRATELMPAHAHLWPLKKHDGRAEAAMMILYAEKHL